MKLAAKSPAMVRMTTLRSFTPGVEERGTGGKSDGIAELGSAGRPSWFCLVGTGGRPEFKTDAGGTGGSPLGTGGNEGREGGMFMVEGLDSIER